MTVYHSPHHTSRLQIMSNTAAFHLEQSCRILPKTVLVLRGVHPYLKSVSNGTFPRPVYKKEVRDLWLRYSDASSTFACRTSVVLQRPGTDVDDVSYGSIHEVRRD